MQNYTSFQLTFPIDLSYYIDISDPVFTFREVLDSIDLSSFISRSESKGPGRPKYDPVKLLRVVLFSFMENGYLSLRNIEKACRNDLRYIWLLERIQPPTHVTIGNFINNELSDSIDDIFSQIMGYIVEKDDVDLDHAYIDGTKIRANSNMYSWVWKKQCITSRDKVFGYITSLFEKMNSTTLAPYSVRITTREKYCIEYVEEMLSLFKNVTKLDEKTFVYGKGKRKTEEQRQYEELAEYLSRLKRYAECIEKCGEKRNSYSKTDPGATFWRIKRDYMGNDQLLPAYNMQLAVCDEYIAVVDVQQYASDTDCFIPLLERFHDIYGKYPRYPTGDAGYGSFNNFLYCAKHGMEKFMKFPMYDKTVKDQKYREDPFKSQNFKITETGDMLCPNGKKFIFKERKPIKGNKFGRKEEIYECEDCSGCPMKAQCTKAEGNRTIHVNNELTAIHKEVLENLNCIHGALLRMNRSIQAEGAFGIMKWDRSYKRVYRRGITRVFLEFKLVALGFDLYKYHNKKKRAEKIA